MSKEIDINNEEQILKECDFDYYYNSENCSRELCKFYNDICHEEDNKFAKTEAYVDLGRIGITLNKQAKQISDLETKLAEKDSEIKVGEFWHSAYKGKQLDYDKIYAELRQSYDENEKLKQQLAESEKKYGYMKDLWVDERVKADKLCGLLNKEIERFLDVEKQLAEKKKEIEQLKTFKVTIGTMETNQVDISSTTYADQDKISFAVEQLLDVKEEVFGTREMGIIFDIPPVQDAFDVIENKIKQLKEMK